MPASFSCINTVTGTASQVNATPGSLNPVFAISNDPIFPGTAGATLPAGTTAQRGGIAGTMRFNTTTTAIEGTLDGATWVTVASGVGPVLSISGTANRITVSAGVNPVIDISATYVGQASITTLGTVTTGTWNATNVALAHGGTSASLVADNGAIVYSTAGAMALLASTATANQIILSGANVAPTWSTATYPATTTINRLLYSSAANTITDLATANNGVLITSAGGVPSISSTLPGAVQGNITSVGTITAGVWNGTAINETHGGTNQTTYILGDTLYASAANTLSKLPGNITAGIQYLAQTGTGAVSAAPVWTTISGGDIAGAALTKTDDTNVTLTLGGTPTTALLRAASLTLGWAGQLSLTRGGTNASLVANNGGIFYSTATAGAILAGTATAQQMLQSGATSAPAWSTSTWPATTTINQILYSSAANVVSGLATANRAVLTTTAAGVPVMTALAADGQLIIGSTAGAPAAASLSAGAGIVITPGSNSITIAATSASGVGRLLSFQVLTTGTAATYTKPAGVSSILVECLGAGGGGGGGTTVATYGLGAGGGGGAYCRLWIAVAAATYTYTVGAGGTGGANAATPATAGTATTFSTLSAGGGALGTAGPAVAAGTIVVGGAGGTASGGNLNYPGMAGGYAFGTSVNGVAGAGGNSGNGAGGAIETIVGGGSAANGASSAANTGGGGAGGGVVGANTFGAGGNGGSGLIVVWEFS